MNRAVSTLLAASATVVVFGAAASQASAATVETNWNFDPYWPTTCTCSNFTGFEVILPGNQTGTATGNYNSFVNPTTSITYDSGLDQTTIKYFSSTGSTIPLGPTTGAYGPSGSPVPHFGFTGDIPGSTTGGEKLPPVSMQWLYTGSGSVGAPGLGINFKSNAAPTSSNVKYLIEYVTVTSGGQSTGTWFELPYSGGYKANFTGSTGSTVDLSNAKFFLSPTEIPLDNLNSNDYPPSGSQFKPIPGIPDGTSLAPGASLLGASTPEPATWAMMLLGLAGVGAMLRYRRRQEPRAAI